MGVELQGCSEKMDHEQEIEQLKMLVGDLFSKVESLSERVCALEDENYERSVAKPKEPEPILTCVQCLSEYKESGNAEGSCDYHTGTIIYGYTNKLSCCNNSANNVESLIAYTGCVKGKHHSKHHSTFFYTNYLVFMRDLSNKAKEKFLVMDIYDYVAEACEWAEVGFSKDNTIFVVAGGMKSTPTVCTAITLQELEKLKAPSVLFGKTDKVGWSLKAELLTSATAAKAIVITIKTCWSKTPYVKKANFNFEGESIAIESIESLSDPRQEKPSTNYSIPEESCTGPTLDPGTDYSLDRKTDYAAVASDEAFAIEMVQLGPTVVDSDTWGARDGQWTNTFTINVKVINRAMEIISVTDVLGEYKNAEGEWVKCDEVYVGLKGNRFYETRDFLLDGAVPTAYTMKLGIKIEDRAPNGHEECRRAHLSLPQPLLLRVTLVDLQNRTASLMFEQGNTPLSLQTRETRQKGWAKKKPLLFHLLADDSDLRKRSDVAVFYDDDNNLIYRPAPNNEGGQYFSVRDSMLDSLAYKAKKSGEKEQELTSLRKENKGSKIEAFTVVDLENQYTFGLKVVITTPTASATGYFLLPRKEDLLQAFISVAPTEVELKSEMTVTWKLPRASKNDKIDIYSRYGASYLTTARNRQEETEGSTKIKAPGTPGVYEVRYYPSCFQSNATGLRNSVYVASAIFTVVTVA